MDLKNEIIVQISEIEFKNLRTTEELNAKYERKLLDLENEYKIGIKKLNELKSQKSFLDIREEQMRKELNEMQTQVDQNVQNMAEITRQRIKRMFSFYRPKHGFHARNRKIRSVWPTNRRIRALRPQAYQAFNRSLKSVLQFKRMRPLTHPFLHYLTPETERLAFGRNWRQTFIRGPNLQTVYQTSSYTHQRDTH